MEKRIVIGYKGEIGSAILNIFNATMGVDTENLFFPAQFNDIDFRRKKADRLIMHICIPYTDNFISTVIKYAAEHKPNIIIIHTTCAIGTTRTIDKVLGDNTDMRVPRCRVVHASVNCRHPNTEADIRKYDMFVGALDDYEGNEVCDYIERFGIITYLCDTPESSEFNKIAGTEYCRGMVQFFDNIKALADSDSKLNWKECIAYFENLMNKSDGWKRVYRRGDRIDTPISGKHCLNSNNELWLKYLNAKTDKILINPKCKDIIKEIQNYNYEGDNQCSNCGYTPMTSMPVYTDKSLTPVDGWHCPKCQHDTVKK